MQGWIQSRYTFFSGFANSCGVCLNMHQNFSIPNNFYVERHRHTKCQHNFLPNKVQFVYLLMAIIHKSTITMPEPIIQIKLPIILFQTFLKLSTLFPQRMSCYSSIFTQKHFSNYCIVTSNMSLCRPGGKSALDQCKNICQK